MYAKDPWSEGGGSGRAPILEILCDDLEMV